MTRTRRSTSEGSRAAPLPALLDALGQASTGVVLLGDPGGPHLERWYANEPAAAIIGYTIDELYAVPVENTLVPEQRQVLAQMIARFRAGQPVPPALEFDLLHKNGDRIPVEMAVGRIELATSAVVRGRDPRDRAATGGADVAARGRSHRLARRAGGGRRARDQQSTDRGAAQPAVAAAAGHDEHRRAGARARAPLRRHLHHGGAPSASPATRARCRRCASRSDTRQIDLAAVVSSALRLAAPTLQPHANVVRQIVPGAARSTARSRAWGKRKCSR